MLGSLRVRCQGCFGAPHHALFRGHPVRLFAGKSKASSSDSLASQESDLEQLVAELATMAANPPASSQRDEKAVRSKLAALRKLHDGSATALASSFSETPQHATAVLKACAVARDGRGALKLLDALAAPVPAHFHAAVGAVARADMWRSGVDLLARMHEDGVLEAAMGQACAEERGTTKAKLSKHFKKQHANAYAATIDACRRAGQWQRSLSLLRDLREAGVAQPSAVSWNSCLEACAQANAKASRRGGPRGKRGGGGSGDGSQNDASGASGDAAMQAFELFAEMQRCGVVANARTFGALLSICEHRGWGSKALALLQQMREQHEDKPLSHKPAWPTWPPSIYSYGQAISACGNAGDAAGALALLQQMHEHEGAPGAPADIVQCYNRAITACARSSVYIPRFDTVGSEPTLHDGSSAAVPVRGVGGAKSAEHGAARGGKAAGGWHRALELLEEMQARGVAPDVISFNAAMSACEKEGRWREALQLLARMQQQGTADDATGSAASDPLRPDSFSYCTAISACGRGGEPLRALELLEELIELPREARCEANEFCFNAAIAACARAGMADEALDLLSRMKLLGVQPARLAYNSAISACEKACQPLRAVSLLNEMSSKPRLRPDVFSFSAAISACEKGGLTQMALDLLDRMKRQHVPPNAVTYGAAIAACGKSGDATRALSLLQEMKGRGISPGVVGFGATISACFHGDAWERALLVLEQMQREHPPVLPDLICYSAAISACAKAGKVGEVLQLLAEMRSAGVMPDVIVYQAVISSCAAAGDPASAAMAADIFAEAVNAGMLQQLQLQRAGTKVPMDARAATKQHVLDLHEGSVGVATEAVRFALAGLRESYRTCERLGEEHDTTDLHIVTGRGRHSAHSMPLIRPAVLELLHNQLKPPLQAELLRGNEGIVAVGHQALSTWCKAADEAETEKQEGRE